MPRSREKNLERLLERVRARDPRAVARALSIVEDEPDGHLAAALFPYTGRAHIVGVTGAPGSGKSTLVSAVVAELRRDERTVGVVAVDPSSPFSGGAVLGDRVRMSAHSGDDGVFIRSMASRGTAGGLALATGAAVRVLDAAGFEVIVVETVGAGQAEVEIADEAHTTVVVAVAGLGDDIQAIKAGILEIADVYCVNKADTGAADKTVAHLRMMLSLGHRGREEDWAPPVLQTVATSGKGVSDLVSAIDDHAVFLREGEGWRHRERVRAAAELRRRLHAALVDGALESAGADRVNGLLDRIVARDIDPAAAAAELTGGRAGGDRQSGAEVTA